MSNTADFPWSTEKSWSEERRDNEKSCEETVNELLKEKSFDEIIDFLGYVESIKEVGKEFVDKMIEHVLSYMSV